MKASIKWLKEFVDFSLTPAETADALTMAGLEVEDIVPNSQDEGDYILEISVTPNRPDCLSIMGIAREISAILKLPFNDYPVKIENEEGVRPLIEIADSNLCSRYSSRIINGIEVRPSPEWISKRLESHGFRPTNNIVDITNYVLLEMGHPMHAFDLNKLDGGRIVVKTAGSENKFRTLDNTDRTLTRDMLLIWDSKKPVAIAGIMGGLNTEVTPSTTGILIESAHFNPVSIRRTSKALNLVSESSYRFERGADIKRITHTLDRVTQLIVKNAGGETTKTTDIYIKPIKPKPISLKLRKTGHVLGADISPASVQKILTRLGFETKMAAERITVTPPSFRHDIQSDIDVIEEIARLYGYDKLPSTLPKITMQPISKNIRWNFVKKLKDSLCKSGYYEVINYSFLNPTVLDKLKLSPRDNRRNLIKIRNPLKKEDEALRTTLIPALLDNIRLNLNRGEKSLRFFEVSSVFFDLTEKDGNKEQKLPEEIIKMAAIYLKDNNPFLWQSRHDGFYDLKGLLENLLTDLGLKNYSFLQDPSLTEPYFHPGKSCVIKIDGNVAAVMGALHPDVAQSFDVPSETYILEADIDTISSSVPSKVTFRPLPKYPYIERDIAIVVSNSITTAKAEKTIRNINSDLIESIRLFDVYTGKHIPEGKKSLAFSIRYRGGDRTLTDNEVNELHSRILKELKNSLKAELRS